MSSGSQMGQSFAAPPEVPAPILSALRQAFDETMKDPGFVARSVPHGCSSIRWAPMN